MVMITDISSHYMRNMNRAEADICIDIDNERGVVTGESKRVLLDFTYR